MSADRCENIFYPNCSTIHVTKKTIDVDSKKEAKYTIMHYPALMRGLQFLKSLLFKFLFKTAVHANEFNFFVNVNPHVPMERCKTKFVCAEFEFLLDYNRIFGLLIEPIWSI